LPLKWNDQRTKETRQKKRRSARRAERSSDGIKMNKPMKKIKQAYDSQVVFGRQGFFFGWRREERRFKIPRRRERKLVAHLGPEAGAPPGVERLAPLWRPGRH